MKIFLSVPLFIILLTGCASSEEQLVKQANKIHSSILTVDTHCDTPMEFSDSTFDLGVKHVDGCVDFPRMVEGGLHAEFFAVFIGQGIRNDSAFNKVHQKALNTFDAIHKNVSKNSSMAELALTADDAYRIWKSGKIAAFIGVENGYPIGRDISRVKQYYDLGARYITLAHTKNNDICDSSTDAKGPENNGLSPFGEQVVKEMNRLGMMVDISHISDKSFYDVLKVTKAPVIASHSSCRALCGSPRNLTDDMLLALKENQTRYGDYNSLSDSTKKLMRAEYQDVQKKYEKSATVKDVVDHIDHVVQVIGIDYVGIGTDFDGGGGVDGCRTAAEMKNITVELLRRGYSKADITKIWGANVMRVLRNVEKLK